VHGKRFRLQLGGLRRLGAGRGAQHSLAKITSSNLDAHSVGAVTVTTNRIRPTGDRDACGSDNLVQERSLCAA